MHTAAAPSEKPHFWGETAVVKAGTVKHMGKCFASQAYTGWYKNSIRELYKRVTYICSIREFLLPGLELELVGSSSVILAPVLLDFFSLALGRCWTE